MPSTDTAPQPPAVEKPKHKLPELTTYELTGYRRQLEQAIAYFDRQEPVPAVRVDLQARLDAVTAEQDDRKKLADA
jgi:hypothetical protein